MFNKELKKRIHTVLKGKANYVSFAFGHKFTAGVNTKQFSILVFVSKKDPNVAEKDRIPDTIEGYPTDVQLYSHATSLTVSPSYHCIQCNDLSDTDGKTPLTCMFTDQTTTTGPHSSAYTVSGLIHRSTFVCGTPGNNYNKPQVAGGMSGAPWGGCTITTIAQDVPTQELLILGNQHCLSVSSNEGFVVQSQLLSSYTGGIDGIVTSQDVTSFVANTVFRQGEGSSPNIVGVFAKTNFQPYNIIGAISHLTCDELADLTPPVPCYKADVAAYKVLPNVIPMQGILQIGDGPFEWMTEEDFCELYCGSPDCSDCVGNTVHVYKSGRTTGTQTPAEDFIVVSVDLELNVFKEFLSGNLFGGRKYQATIGIQHREDANKPFGGGGDSGSPVLVEHNGKLKILGILTWGTPSPSQGIPDQSDAPTTATPATIFLAPMWQVAEALQVKAWNYTQQTGAGEIIVNSDEPTITVSGRTYVKGSETSLPITHVKDN